jgi:hypothetical protein
MIVNFVHNPRSLEYDNGMVRRACVGYFRARISTPVTGGTVTSFRLRSRGAGAAVPYEFKRTAGYRMERGGTRPLVSKSSSRSYRRPRSATPKYVSEL